MMMRLETEDITIRREYIIVAKIDSSVKSLRLRLILVKKNIQIKSGKTIYISTRYCTVSNFFTSRNLVSKIMK